MKLLMSKKKRNEMLQLIKQRDDEIRRQREMQARVNIKRTLNEMKNQSKKLDQFKKNYIDRAKKAALVGNSTTYDMAKSGLKISLTKQKFLDSMIVNFEVAMEINDMNKVIGQFVEGINIISGQMKQITTSFDMSQAQNAFDNAMANNLTQYEALDAFMTTAVNSFDSMDAIGESISDDEINQLINHQAVDKESEIDKQIEQRIGQVRDRITNI
jgi:hypothetical protein